MPICQKDFCTWLILVILDTCKKIWYTILYGFFLVIYPSHTRFSFIANYIPEFLILVIFVTFILRLCTRTAKYQPHTIIPDINLLEPLRNPTLFLFCCGQTFCCKYESCFLDTSDIFETWSF